jgi:hypothetical protein
VHKLFPLFSALVVACASCTNSRSSDATAVPLPTHQVAASVRIDFEDGVAGTLPSGFLSDHTGGGRAGTWSLAHADGTPSGSVALAQTDGDDTGSRYPLCVYEPLRAKDVRATVRFRARAGEVDRAGGLVAHYQDKDNYYVTRANALEGNVRLYKVVGGQRKQLASADADVRSGAWHELSLEVLGNHLRVFYEGRLLLEADDTALPGAGRVGMWTKADSITDFDDLVIETLATR